MKPYTVITCDNMTWLRAQPDCSVDVVITDPPYGLSPDGRARTFDDIEAGRSRGGFMGHAWDAAVPGVTFWREVLRVLKPGAHVAAFGGTRTYHRMVCAAEDAGFEVRDMLAWLHGEGFPKSLNLGEGRGTALKPAIEPVMLARKPPDGTIAQTVERWGTGALNIDACRVRAVDGGSRIDSVRTANANGPYSGGWLGRGAGDRETYCTPDAGRFPANVCHDGSDPVLAEFPATSNQGPSGGWMGAPNTRSFGGFTGQRERERERERERDDDPTDSAARFFYCAKPSTAEREVGLEAFATASAAEITGRKPGSAGLRNPRAGIRAGNAADSRPEGNPRANVHPTVKPVALMHWLVRLLVPPGGTVLDPFCGSGTTGMACAVAGVPFIGLEQDPTFAEIARARIAAAVAGRVRIDNDREVAVRPPADPNQLRMF